MTRKKIHTSVSVFILALLGFLYLISRPYNEIFLPKNIKTVADKVDGPILANGSPVYHFSYSVPVGLPGADTMLAREKTAMTDATRFTPDDLQNKITEDNNLGVPSGDAQDDVVALEGVSPNRDYIIYSLTSEVFEAGAAHPGTNVNYFIFDKKGNEYHFSDLFPEEDKAVSFLSASVRDALLADSTKPDYKFDMKDDWFLEGTSPDVTNFRAKDENYGTSVVPLEDGMHVHFDQYQLAAYAVGTFDVVLPYTKYDFSKVMDVKFIR